jgi:hypothetical protein
MPEQLEDALNDLAVIRTTFETLEAFPDDPDLRAELAPLIRDARGSLARRLAESRPAPCGGPAGAQALDLKEFKKQLLRMAHRQDLAADQGPELASRYEFLPQHPVSELRNLPPSAFANRVFDDLLDALTDDRSYTDRLAFNTLVFQKFVAVMFCLNVAADPRYYGERDSP